ncbi:MAG: ABC transporter substrate-binding protein, partial [Planctomycetes bacterium]|nr:ABC transporter substrate-binding protein [Planctomycetota bacterium]
FTAVDDAYTPEKTVAAVRRLVDEGVFAMLGNVGTPTATVALPILAERGVPAVGFFTGAGVLRPGEGRVLNYRASYSQEVAAVLESAIAAGLSPRAVCAFVQNDGYGMAGVIGLRRVLERQSGVEDMVKALDAILGLPGEDPPRNGIGPVGVYQRNTFASRDGYVSLKDWERRNGLPCRLVVTVGTYNAVAKFAAYARYKGEQWLLSAVSFTGADALRRELAAARIDDGVVVSQVVPPLDAALPIVVAAKSALGSDFGYVSLEGFIVGRLFLAVAREVEGELTRDAFMRAALGRRFNVGGLALDFTDDNQGSDLVVVDLLEDGRYRTLDAGDWRRLLN